MLLPVCAVDQRMVPVAAQPEAVRVVLVPAQMVAELTEIDNTAGALAGEVSSARADRLVNTNATHTGSGPHQKRYRGTERKLNFIDERVS